MGWRDMEEVKAEEINLASCWTMWAKDFVPVLSYIVINIKMIA